MRGGLRLSVAMALALIGLAAPPLAEAAAADGGKQILIELANQRLTATQVGQVMLITPVTTGRAELPTPTGLTAVYSKPTNFVMHSPWAAGSAFWYPDSFIRYGLYFRSGGYYIHDASWRDSYGPGTNAWHRDANGDWLTGSHGCINVPLPPMIWLYNWADIGTPVLVVWST